MKKIMSAGPVKRKEVHAKKYKKTAVPKHLAPKPFPIVAFGASAGGMKAFTTLLKHLDPNLGMAYVLIMHLSPDHKSALAEIVQSKTTMPVQTVKNGMEVRANNIYVIPPKTFMSVVDGHLTLAPRSSTSRSNFAVDYFLTGLASIYKNNAIGVILSGTATDGTLGLKAIKAEGGITFAQDETAEFSGMPQSAVDSGYVDFKLPPEAIASELGRLKKTPYTNLPADKIDAVSVSEINSQAEDLKKILSIVRDKFGVDFFLHYKHASVYRRVLRRMVLNQFEKLSEYANMLKTSPGEVEALFYDFLINVTNFFRDLDFYDTLSKEIFPAIIKQLKPNAPIRIWVAGCATGEEAYSIAICLTEYLAKKKLVVAIQIFGSDLDARAIEKARQGIYPVSALLGVSETYLKQYFKKVDSHFQVVKAIRAICVFAQHNLLKDPPFSRMNLISCQNVLIYLETNPQKKILQTFHYALVPNGYLFLAKSETIGHSTDLFESLDKKIRYYSRKAATPQGLDFALHLAEKSPEDIAHRTGGLGGLEVEKEMGKLMLSRFVYPGVAVNKHFAIIQFFGETSPYLAPAGGKASLNVLKMIREDLLIDLRSLLQQVRKTEKTVVKEGITIYNKQIAQELSLEVVPKTSQGEIYFLVVFKEKVHTQGEGPKTKRSIGKKDKDTISKLEAELVQAREVIRTTNEEYETTYEELQANNEEILSSNEELQSVNEELETSKEELQSSNEELTTINEELSERNIELKESHDYAEAIVETMHGPLLVLASNLQVRTANKAFYQSFQLLREHTEGSFLYDLGDGTWDIPALRSHLKDIINETRSFKSFELKYFFPGLGERDMIINVYRLLKGKNSGETLILLAFDDFTRRFNAETLLEKTQQQLKLSLIGDAIGTWWWDLQTNEVKWSKENEQLNGLEEGSFGGNYTDWKKIIHPEDLIAVEKSIEKSIEKSVEKSVEKSLGRHPIEIEYRVTWPDKSLHWILSKGNLYCDQNHKPERIVGVSVDNTERKLSSEALERQVSARTADLTRANTALVNANRQLEQFVFISSHDLQEPLRKIQTFSNFLADDNGTNLSVLSKKYLDKINTSATRMSTLLNELYSFSMLKDDPSQFVRTDLNDILKKVVRDLETTIATKKCRIKLDPLPFVQADPAQMHQLFYQLIGNALKFCKVNPDIRVSSLVVAEEDLCRYPELQKNVSYVSVSVIDNGIGFDQKYAEKIFSVFQQLRDIKTDGTGIGLAVCKKIVENHRGAIVANGKVDAGATFTVFLPAG
ncbi:MAG: CheR family methyltransferase [Cyclobacteriaceae bacterium]